MESATASNEDTTASSGGKQKQFPYQLYNLLEIASEYSALAITGEIYPITWCEHGRTIRIINRNAFEKVLPLFFGATKYLSFEKQLLSFEKQLYRWQFKRIKDGPNQGSDPFFLSKLYSILKTQSIRSNNNMYIKTIDTHLEK